jgi:DNA processing protein
LFAVPGSPLDPRCRGSNYLIRSGAHLTESAEDVLSNLPDHPTRQGLARSPMFARGLPPGVAEPPDPYEPAPIDPAEARRRVLQSLGPEPTPVDDLVRRCQLSASAAAAALLELELGGRVEMLPGNKACLIGQEDAAFRVPM